MTTYDQLREEMQKYEVTHRDAVAIGLLLIASILMGMWKEWREKE